MKFNETTHMISMGALIVTAVYTFIHSGISGILLCGAVTFFVAAFVDELEIVTAFAILFALFYVHYLKKYLRRFESFTNPTDIIQRIKKDQRVMDSKGPSAVARSYSVEGFESSDADKAAASQAPATPAPAVPSEEVKEVTATADAVNTSAKEGGDAAVKTIQNEEFQSATNELFKLGKMPSEHKEGPMLDAGGTLMKAMGSFDPDTTKKMTHDTKQLLETQKSLMNMLTQMRPILSDGKELLQTFSGMFGGMGGMGSAASQFKVGK
jgi:hypothetical protein